MTDLGPLVAHAKKSEYFSGAPLAEDLERFLAERADSCRALGRELQGAEHLYFVGSGGSLATLQTAKFILERFVEVPCEAVHGYDLIWRNPARLGSGSVAFFASYSGDTEDTVAALRFAGARGARTVGIVRGGDSTIAGEADDVIEYGSAAIFELPIAALTSSERVLLRERAPRTPLPRSRALCATFPLLSGRPSTKRRHEQRSVHAHSFPAGICTCSELVRLPRSPIGLPSPE